MKLHCQIGNLRVSQDKMSFRQPFADAVLFDPTGDGDGVPPDIRMRRDALAGRWS